MDEIWSLSSLFIRYILGLVAIKEYIYIICAQFFFSFFYVACIFVYNLYSSFFTESQRDIIPNDNVYNNKFNYAVSEFEINNFMKTGCSAKKFYISEF
jgi:hypothetical protein